MKKAIFFDMDGVLVDSVEGNFLSWQKVLSEIGLNVSLEELKLYEGMKSEVMIQEIAMMYNFEISLDEILLLQKEKRIMQKNFFSIEPYPITEKLIYLKELGFKMYIVSGSPRERVLDGVSNFFPGIFEDFISACDVSLGKPHPEPYLRAFELTGYEIDECIVVENAPLGIKAGKNGGFEVIAIGSTLHRDHLSEADYYVDNHLELFNLLEEKIKVQNLLN